MRTDNCAGDSEGKMAEAGKQQRLSWESGFDLGLEEWVGLCTQGRVAALCRRGVLSRARLARAPPADGFSH